MLYVIRTFTGKEDEMCMWINTCVDKKLYTRCFVPLFQDVVRRGGVGHIVIKKMFDGYLFLETDKPEEVEAELKKLPRYSSILSVTDTEGKTFLPISASEEVFLNTILVDGMMRVSYVRPDKGNQVKEAIGPLEHYIDKIVRLDIHHRRALVKISLAGAERQVKFGLWTDADPKLDSIEIEKQSRKKQRWNTIFKVGDKVINTKGLFGDMPVEVKEVHSGKNSLMVRAVLFGRNTDIEMDMDDVVICEDRATGK